MASHQGSCQVISTYRVAPGSPTHALTPLRPDPRRLPLARLIEYVSLRMTPMQCAGTNLKNWPHSSLQARFAAAAIIQNVREAI